MNFEENYVPLVQEVLQRGKLRQSRNGNTHALFGIQIKADDLLGSNFPLLVGRRLFPKAVFGELAAFFNSPKSVADFEKQGCNYWEKWGNEDGSINIDYGNTWSDFNGVNQLELVVNGIKNNPHGRRHLISGWRPDTMLKTNLPCCHYAYQWFVDGGYLDMIWVQRSVDLMIGLPADAILAAAWNVLMANFTGYKPGVLTFQLGDVHIYEEHQLGAMQYLRQYWTSSFEKPTYRLNPNVHSFKLFTNEDIIMNNYFPSDSISFLLKE